MPSSPAAGWIQTFSKPDSRAIRPLATQFSATPPATHKFFAPLVSRSHRARASSTFSVSSCTRQARSSQCRIDGLASQLPRSITKGCLKSVVQCFAVGEFEQVFELLAAAIGREAHQLAAFVPVAEDV